MINSLKSRLAAVRPTRWVRFACVAILYCAWVCWMQSPWLLIFLLLLADIYLTQYIPWSWWKESKNKLVVSVMSWVDAIVYALVLVYFIFAFIGQNYQIPSSSLEKSLLVGDYLWVNKMVYGPRVPQTPIHFPLTQHTLPIINTKSYLDRPQIKYKRLAGLRSVQRGDIVVFNFPAGDTVALKVQNPDYYTLVEQYGRDAIRSNPQVFGDIIYRPVDRRENYVKRCIGLPGETLKIVDDTVYIDGKAIATPREAQYNYYVQTTGGAISDAMWEELGISVDDRNYLQGTNPPVYQLPLTADMVEKLRSSSNILDVVRVPVEEYFNVYPISHNYGWTRANMGDIWIPKKGETLQLTSYNLPIYERVIRNYEGNDLRVLADGTITINGAAATSYTFKMDYYWMMGDNRDNSADSRYWGFVPEDHIVGTPVVILISFDKDKSIFHGGIRTNRILRNARNEKL